ncbi:MAG: hypothetical protein ACRBG0_27385 [Lewinella sp.]|jgi:hypothetical protein|uniref:hypothetical protein n=1 Tax=Lewinella sp. TaxID=2004506 RepID=UPI003D6AD11A
MRTSWEVRKVTFKVLLFILSTPFALFSQEMFKYEKFDGELDRLFRKQYSVKYQRVQDVLAEDSTAIMDNNLGIVRILEYTGEEDKELSQELFDEVYWCSCMRYKDSIALAVGLGFQGGIGVGAMGDLSSNKYQAIVGLHGGNSEMMQLEDTTVMIGDLEIIIPKSGLVLSDEWRKGKSDILEWKMSGFSNAFYEKSDDLWIRKRFFIDLHFRCRINTFDE